MAENFDRNMGEKPNSLLNTHWGHLISDLDIESIVLNGQGLQTLL